jgi:hypothetical protein
MSLFCLTAISGVVLTGGIISPDYIKDPMWSAGAMLSQKMSVIPYWGSHVEPVLLNSAVTAVTAIDSFLKGMISDNSGNLDDELETFHQNAIEILKE